MQKSWKAGLKNWRVFAGQLMFFCIDARVYRIQAHVWYAND
jgi:hypothetical protein